MGRALVPKDRCCQDRPRCRRCPLVLVRLERAGLARRTKKGRFKLLPGITKKQLKAARR
jgi:hypothetical protein